MTQASPMTAEHILDLIRKIMAREFDLDAQRVLPTSTLEDLDLDSIDAVDLAIAVEEELGYRFTTDDMERFETLADVVDVIARSRAGGAAG
ncbi:MAG: phosphopantetheine-binding protein [Myxococcota bacterium]|nr:acyl carrier protein [Myxococcales bacterium]